MLAFHSASENRGVFSAQCLAPFCSSFSLARAPSAQCLAPFVLHLFAQCPAPSVLWHRPFSFRAPSAQCLAQFFFAQRLAPPVLEQE